MEKDYIIVSTVQYGFISKFQTTITLNRKSYKPLTPPTLFYNSPIHPNFFSENTINIDNVIYTSPYQPNTNSATLTINNIENIKFETLPTYLDEQKTFTITIEPTKNTISPNIDQNTSIYIVEPPLNGQISSNLYMSINDFEYFITDKTNITDDVMKIRLIKSNSISDKSFNVIIKYYLIHLDTIYLNTDQIEYPLTTSLISNGYYWNNDNLIHNNKPTITVPNNLKIIHDFPKKQISLNTTSINIDLLAFNHIDLTQYFHNQLILHVLESSPPKSGYIQNNIYYNTQNINDDFKIIVSLDGIIGFNTDIITFNINIQNNFNIQYSSQYIKHAYDNQNITTISVDGISNSNIYLYNESKELIDSLDNVIINQDNLGITTYILQFGNITNTNILDIYPKIQHNVKNTYYSETIIPNDIFPNNLIDYQFKNLLNDDFEIEFTFIATPILENIPENTFIFHIYLGNTNIIFSHNGVYHNNFQNFLTHIELNKLYLIRLTPTNLFINNQNFQISFQSFQSFKLLYNLSDNLVNNNSNLFNYSVSIDIKNLTISSALDSIDGQNVLLGSYIKSSGIDNICIGKDFNTFGNNSIVIGNDIGSSQELLFDNGLHDAIIIGNKSFQKSLAKNIISIGNNIFKDFEINNQEEYQTASTFFGQNPILIGNDLTYSPQHVINIGNKIIIEKNGDIHLNNIDVLSTFQTIQSESVNQSININNIQNQIQLFSNNIYDNLSTLNHNFDNISNIVITNTNIFQQHSNITSQSIQNIHLYTSNEILKLNSNIDSIDYDISSLHNYILLTSNTLLQNISNIHFDLYQNINHLNLNISNVDYNLYQNILNVSNLMIEHNSSNNLILSNLVIEKYNQLDDKINNIEIPVIDDTNNSSGNNNITISLINSMISSSSNYSKKLYDDLSLSISSIQIDNVSNINNLKERLENVQNYASNLISFDISNYVIQDDLEYVNEQFINYYSNIIIDQKLLELNNEIKIDTIQSIEIQNQKNNRLFSKKSDVNTIHSELLNSNIEINTYISYNKQEYLSLHQELLNQHSIFSNNVESIHQNIFSNLNNLTNDTSNIDTRILDIHSTHIPNINNQILNNSNSINQQYNSIQNLTNSVNNLSSLTNDIQNNKVNIEKNIIDIQSFQTDLNENVNRLIKLNDITFDNVNSEINEFRNNIQNFKTETISDLNLFKNDINTDFTTFTGNLNTFQDNINSDFDSFKTETTNNVSTFQQNINSDFDSFKTETTNNVSTFQDNINADFDSFKSETTNNVNTFQQNIKTDFDSFKTETTSSHIILTK